MRVCKCRVGGFKYAAEEGVVYVGRAFKDWPASVLANPIAAGKKCPECGARHAAAETLPCYRRWLWRRLKADEGFRRTLQELPADATLGCWCVDTDSPAEGPEVCHAQVLVKARTWLNSQR